MIDLAATAFSMGELRTLDLATGGSMEAVLRIRRKHPLCESRFYDLELPTGGARVQLNGGNPADDAGRIIAIVDSNVRAEAERVAQEKLEDSQKIPLTFPLGEV